jgi:putative ABC transport system permease protein
MKASPPKFFLRFFRWYCHPKLVHHIEGDLIEVYRQRLEKIGRRKADIKFVVDVMLLFRPRIIKPMEGHQNLNTYGMYKSYFKIGWRNLIRNKSYATINIAGLALSITCCILIFSLVTHHLSFDNFHENPERVYRIVTEMHRDQVSYSSAVPSPLGYHYRNDYTFSEKTARIFIRNDVFIAIKKNGELIKFTETNGLAFTEPEFLTIFNFPLLQGNKSTALREPNTALLTLAAARKYFGSENPIGEVLWLDNKLPFTVIGVLHDLPVNTDVHAQIFVSYASLKSYDVWMADETRGWSGTNDGMYCFTLLKPGISPAQVENALQPYVKKFRPNSKNVHHYKLQSLADIHFNAHYDGAMEKGKLWTLAIIGAVLLVTACLNFINLATSQALTRSREVGVRKVLGGFRQQLFWQFIFETGMIAMTSVVLAIMLASLVAPRVNALFNIQIPFNFFADGATLMFGVGIGAVVTIIAGYYPALILSGFQPVAALKGNLSQYAMGGFNIRRTLIVTQFVISQVLIIGMIVVMNQMQFIRQSDLGFDKNAIVMVGMGADTTGTKSTVLKNEIGRLPGVENVSLCWSSPASQNNWGNSIRFDNSTEEANFSTSIKLADADYLSTFDIELVAGKNLTSSDTAREMLVNETMVKKLGFSSPEEALGRVISANGGQMKAPIVGVVKDFHDRSFHEDISAVLITSQSVSYSNYAIKLNLKDARSTLAEIEKLWIQQHSDQIFNYEFLEDHIARFYDADKIILDSIQVFSFIAIFIGCLGLYGLVSFMVAQKTKEVGIRKVLGGSIGHICWIFGKEFTRLIGIASALAIPIGIWLMNDWLQAFTFRTPISMWMILMALGGTLMITAITISYRVAKSATNNPANSLKSE